MKPPIASDVKIKQVKGGTSGRVQVVADFGRGKLKGSFHAVALSTGKVVLRDDGKGGDEAPGDGRFTVTVSENVPALTNALESNIRRRSAPGVRLLPSFRGREVIPTSTTPVTPHDLELFRAGDFMTVRTDILCLLFLDVSPPHSLMVTNTAVVEDPTRTSNPCGNSPNATGAWTFGKLLTSMANTPATGVTAEDFVKQWLDTWLHDQTVNSDQVPARTALFTKVIKPWAIKSGAPGSVTINNWMSKPLDLKFAPFKLIAIVNRLDLRGNSGYGFTNPGEGRFIFEVLDPSCSPFFPAFTVILEYGLPMHSCKELKDYAQKWYDLKNLPLGSQAYNTKLQEITDVFAAANAAPNKPNGSALNQIRTNEIVLAFADSSLSHKVWELREFNINATSHQLFETTVKQEPAKKYNAKAIPNGLPADVALMADWVNDNENDVINDRHTVPPDLPPAGPPFLGGKSHTESGGFWEATTSTEITSDEARHHFSLNTCSGCHGGETGTGFLHVGGAAFGVEAPLSGFLTGIQVADPAGRPTGNPKIRLFHDLDQREASLERLICTQCKSKVFELVEALTFKPLNMTH